VKFIPSDEQGRLPCARKIGLDRFIRPSVARKGADKIIFESVLEGVFLSGTAPIVEITPHGAEDNKLRIT
jgi:hypothetical protein